MIMLRMESIMATKSIGTRRPASTFIRNGVARGDTNVEQEVIVTESATLPRARYVIRFEATPPGQEPIRITPAATSGSKPNNMAILKPASGMTVNCRSIPSSTGHGMVNTRAKSFVLSVVPMPNMMI